jgi:cytochrome c5
MKTTTLLSLLIVASLAACSKKEPEAAPPPPPIAAPAPVVAAAPPPAAIAPPSAETLVKGEKVYTTTCLSCHGAAVLGAPKLGDLPSWTPRIAKGVAVLYASSIDGLKMMPPRGGNASLKDEELKAAVDYMVSKSQ